jgi:hypothetical protein
MWARGLKQTNKQTSNAVERTDMDNQKIQTNEAYAAEQMAGREKYWSELSIEEKIERLRQVVRQNRENIERETSSMVLMGNFSAT